MAERLRVGISGSYGGMNLGDEAILACLLSELRRALPVEITVFSLDPDDTLQRHGVERAVPVRDLSRTEVMPEIARLDLLLLGGGGILYDADARTYLREVTLAHEAGVPVMLYAIGAGPLKEPAVQAEVRRVLQHVAIVSVRDRHSFRVLEEAGVRRKMAITADPALLLKPEPLPPEALAREGLDSRRRLVGMSVREAGVAAPDLDERLYNSLLANAADYLIDRLDADVVFVPMEHKVLDQQQSHSVISQMARPQHAWVLKGEYSPQQLLGLVGRFAFAVGMRLHFLIFAALQHVPFVALPYASKVVGFMEDMGLETPRIRGVSIGQLIAYIDRAWDLRSVTQEKIELRLPPLRERAQLTNQLAVELLRHKL